MPAVIYKKEREVLEYIAQFQRQFGYSPTLAEIAHATNHRSKSTIHALIRGLVEKGYIQKVEGNNRVLKIIDDNVNLSLMGSYPSIDLPLMGYIAAGKPLEPYTDPNAYFQVPGSMLSGKKTAYALQVKGNSMIDEGIFDGDYVIVEKITDAVNGDIVIAMVDNNLATLKKYYKENDRVVLRPANSEMEPIYPTSLIIQGKVVGLIRRF